MQEFADTFESTPVQRKMMERMMGMEVKRAASAGTNVSNDIVIEVTPAREGIHIELDSCMEKLYGNTIRAVIRRTVESLGVTAVNIKAVDTGALDYTIEARVETAIRRACQ